MQRFFIATILILLFTGCGGAEWAGRYKSEGCLTLEYVEFYQDNTADVKYFGATFATNHKMTRKGNHFHVNIYDFELREDGKMYEEGGYDLGCVLVKDKSHSFWDKIFQP
jgi:hypothetical protein